MAEYSMTYEELSFEINRMIYSIEEEVEKKRLLKYEAEILAAFTGDFTENDKKSISDSVELWHNQITNRSELLFKTTYIPVQSIMLDLVKAMITSGFIDAIMVNAADVDKSAFSVAVCSTIVYTIWEHISNAKKLDDWDFCIYFQAMTHFREFKEFTKENLMEWFPNAGDKRCNMHNNQWKCSYRNSDDTCAISVGDKIDKAISSLQSKGILIARQVEQDKWSYKFKK